MSIEQGVKESINPVKRLGGQIFKHTGAEAVISSIFAAHRVNMIQRFAGDPDSRVFSVLNRITGGNWTQVIKNINKRGGLDLD